MTWECKCPKCGIKYIMYIPPKFSIDETEKLKQCACGTKMEVKTIDKKYHPQ